MRKSLKPVQYITILLTLETNSKRSHIYFVWKQKCPSSIIRVTTLKKGNKPVFFALQYMGNNLQTQKSFVIPTPIKSHVFWRRSKEQCEKRCWRRNTQVLLWLGKHLINSKLRFSRRAITYVSSSGFAIC